MSRSRLVVLAATILLAVVAVAAVVLRGGSEPPPPSAQSRLPQGTVLLIPGFGGGTRELAALADGLRRSGIDTEILDVGTGEDDLRGYAAKASDRAAALTRNGGPAPDLVGYSAGGLTARIAATDHPRLFRKVVQIAAPNGGTQTAELGARFGQCPPACEQMRPGSQLIDALPEPADPSAWLSLWSDTDSVIRPPESSVLPGTTDYRLQQACDRAVEHGAVPSDPQTIAVVIGFLRGSALPAGCVG